jgi:hypothetical protein
MFLKRCARRKAGKKHVYWQLVESYRVRGGCRHRVVAYLGELSKGEGVGWARLGRLLDGKAAAKAQQLSLFDGPGDGEAVPDSIRVDLKKLRVERSLLRRSGYEGFREGGRGISARCIWVWCCGGCWGWTSCLSASWSRANSCFAALRRVARGRAVGRDGVCADDRTVRGAAERATYR